MLQIEFHSEADEEFKAISEYYEACQSGLGNSFAQELENGLKRILRYPLSGAVVVEDFRKCRIRRFPYALIYRAEEHRIFVLAIAHLHRRPDYWVYRH